MVAPHSFAFEIDAGGQASGYISITKTGPGLFKWDFSIRDQPGWISLARTSGSDEGGANMLVVDVDSNGLDPGFYEASVEISGLPVVLDFPQLVLVTLNAYPVQAP